MKKGQVLEGIVKSVDFPNKGRVECEEGIVTVKNAIPGQKVRFSINKLRGGKAEGRLLEVIEHSEIEDMDKICPHFGICGGCVYQPVRYEEQLKIKEAQIKKLIDSVCSDYEFEGIKASPIDEGYRNKMEFSFGDEVKDGPLALGMHKRGSFHDIVTVSECRIVDEDFRLILKTTLEYFKEAGTPFYKKLQHEGYLRHLLVRKAKKTEEILIDLITTTQIADDSAIINGYKNAILGIADKLTGKLAGLLHTYNDTLADAVCNDRTEILYGQDYFYEELLGLRFKITPFSFFQTNSLGAEVLYDTARSYIGDTKDKVVFDLYSGTGTIAQLMASVAKHVVGVEIVEEAVEAAKINAELNGLDNCSFLAGDVLKVLDDIQEKPDLLMLDPPRDGINPKALQKIINYGVERMVYISCKPTSLVRDLVMLQEQGYRVEKVVAVDMFPGTGHVETVVLIQRTNG